jgi:hypothetical protein
MLPRLVLPLVMCLRTMVPIGITKTCPLYTRQLMIPVLLDVLVSVKPTRTPYCIITSSAPIIRLEDSDNDGYGRIGVSNGNLNLQADQGNTVANTVMTFNIDNDEKMRLDAVGRLGIGTDNPQVQLHLEGPPGGAALMRLYDTDGTNRYLELQESSGGAVFIARNDTSNGPIQFRQYNGTTTSIRMTINSSGNMGIGTSDPRRSITHRDQH